MDPFLGEIRLFAGNYAPVGWALCDGQLLSIPSNTALFSLLGTQFGGDGVSNFGLPDLRGRLPMNQGQGPGLSPWFMGEQAGVENVTLSSSQVPAHSHALAAFQEPADATDPTGAAPARAPQATYSTKGAPVALASQAFAGGGGSGAPHSNLMPYLCLTYIIATEGVFPPRS